MYDAYLSMRHTPWSMYYSGWVEKCLGSSGVKVHNGFDRIRSGEFPEELKRRIHHCKNFIIILTSETFGQDDDTSWMTDEIEYAIKAKLNIIPVMSLDFSWPAILPDRIGEIRNYKGISIEKGGYYSLPPKNLSESIDAILGRLQNSQQKESVFISYSVKDLPMAEKVKNLLESRERIRCWMAPYSIPAGGNYGKNIPDAIRKCEIFLVIVSENSQRSNWVPREIGIAINENKVIIPFKIDKAAITPEFELFLINCQIIPACERFDEAYFELTESIADALSR